MYSEIAMLDYGDHKNIVIQCPMCGKTSTIKLDAKKTKLFDAGIKAYKNGALVQNAFPFLTANERELLISGICSKCWNTIVA